MFLAAVKSLGSHLWNITKRYMHICSEFGHHEQIILMIWELANIEERSILRPCALGIIEELTIILWWLGNLEIPLYVRCPNLCFVLWVSELIPHTLIYLGPLNSYFECLNLYFGCRNPDFECPNLLSLYRCNLGAWTYALGIWIYALDVWTYVAVLWVSELMLKVCFFMHCMSIWSR